MNNDEGTGAPRRTRKKKNGNKPVAKVIPFASVSMQPTTNQPLFDKPLHISLTPQQIHKSILHECHFFTTSDHSLIAQELVTEQVKFENMGNYCWLARVEGLEEGEDDTLANVLTITCLEIKVGAVYVHAVYGSQSIEHYRFAELDWQRAEEALLKAAPLIGVCVKRGLFAET